MLTLGKLSEEYLEPIGTIFATFICIKLVQNKKLKTLWFTEQTQLKLFTISNLLTIDCNFDKDYKKFYLKD